MPKVVITDFITDEMQPERSVLDGVAQLVAADAHDEQALQGQVEDADALIVFHNVQITRSTLGRLSQCKVIARCGVGYDNVDCQFARQHGIPVVNIPDYGTEDVADSALGLMLALTRGIAPYNTHLQRQLDPWKYTLVAPLHRLRGRVFGIVGLGRIGTAAAMRAKAFGMRVVFYDPYRPDGYDKALGIERAESLQQLMQQAYVLSLHCPLTAETRQMINADTLAWLPQGSYLVNTARGEVVDTRCIPDALASGQLAGAGLDVLPLEPPTDDDPLIQAWRDPQHPAHTRLIVNPHSAFYCEEGRIEMRQKAAMACRQAIEGRPLRNVVN